MVPEPAQVDPVHHLAQLQVAHHQGPHHHRAGHPDTAVLLRHPGLLGQADARGVNEFPTLFSKDYIFRFKTVLYLDSLA